MPNVHSIVVPCAFDMWHTAVKGPVALLVVEATLPQDGAVLVLMVSVIDVALTAVVLCKFHLAFEHSGMLRSDLHHHLIKRGTLQCFAGSGTTAIASATRRSVELTDT